jgi:hypothetical protein
MPKCLYSLCVACVAGYDAEYTPVLDAGRKPGAASLAIGCVLHPPTFEPASCLCVSFLHFDVACRSYMVLLLVLQKQQRLPHQPVLVQVLRYSRRSVMPCTVITFRFSLRVVLGSLFNCRRCGSVPGRVIVRASTLLPQANIARLRQHVREASRRRKSAGYRYDTLLSTRASRVLPAFAME